MKALSNKDIQKLAVELKDFCGARLQEVRLRGDHLALGLFKNGLKWLMVDMNSESPQLLHITDSQSISFKSEKKPLVLFLNANMLGARLEEIVAPPDLGRVLILQFDKGKEIELRLFPRGQNILIRTGEKQIALHKPKEIKKIENAREELAHENYLPLAERSSIWRSENNRVSTTVKPISSGENLLSKKIEKLNRAMQKITEDIKQKQNSEWIAVGNWLKENQNLQVPEEWRKYIDLKLTFAQNLENAFAQAKEIKRKIAGSQARLNELKNELQSISQNGIRSARVDARQSLLHVAQVKGRTLDLGENVFLYVGKSAEDNLRLLREAKPWSLWLHLRDIPSCHGLLHRAKGQIVSDKKIREAVQYLLEQNFGAKAVQHKGEKFDVIIAECRYVRPIKGDRMGRVHYSDEKTIRHTFE